MYEKCRSWIEQRGKRVRVKTAQVVCGKMDFLLCFLTIKFYLNEERVKKKKSKRMNKFSNAIEVSVNKDKLRENRDVINKKSKWKIKMNNFTPINARIKMNGNHRQLQSTPHHFLDA